MRAVRWILIGVGGVVVVLVATVVVLTLVVDPNRYRGRVAAVVGERVGRPLVIEGDLRVRWFPQLERLRLGSVGLQVGAAHLAAAPQTASGRDVQSVGPRRAGGAARVSGLGLRGMGAEESLLEWRSVTVIAKLWPLLRGQVVAERIRLEGLRLRLRRDAAGHGNWEDLEPFRASPPSEALPTTPGRLAVEPASREAEKPSTEIEGINVRDGMLDYVDEGTGVRVNLSGVELSLGEWRAEQRLPVHAQFLARSSYLPPAGVAVQVDTPGLSVHPESPLEVSAPQLAIKVADAELHGDVMYDQTADGQISARGSLVARTASLRKLVADLGMNQTMPRDPTTLGALELSTGWSYTQGALAARPIALKLDGVTFQGWVERSAAPASGWRFELHGDRIDLGRYVSVDSSSKKPFEIGSLQAIKANGSLVFDEALWADTRMSDVRLRFETREGVGVASASEASSTSGAASGASSASGAASVSRAPGAQP